MASGLVTSTFTGCVVPKRRPSMFSLTMTRGKRSVFIGLFPNEYRAENCALNLEWGHDWKGIITPVPVQVDPQLWGGRRLMWPRASFGVIRLTENR